MISGILGLSSEPLLTFTIIAFALARITLSGCLLTKSISPSRPLFARKAIWSSFDNDSKPLSVELDSEAIDISGMLGLSNEPLLIFTIIAFAFPRRILSVQLSMASMSPSRPLFTKYATFSSLDKESKPPLEVAGLPMFDISGSAGLSTEPLLILTIIAFVLPRITLSL